MLSVNMPFWQAWSMWSAVRGYMDQLYPEKDDSQGLSLFSHSSSMCIAQYILCIKSHVLASWLPHWLRDTPYG